MSAGGNVNDFLHGNYREIRAFGLEKYFLQMKMEQHGKLKSRRI